MSALLVERTRHWRTCDTCDGSGEVFVRHPNYGSYNCPYDGDDEPCPNRDCYEGVIEVWTDPLVAMSFARRMPWAYRLARDRAMKPVRIPGADPRPAIVRYHEAAMRQFCNALGVAA